MNQGPLVSVLVVVRNGCLDILGLLDSIRQQDYGPLEVLVVDGMSDDGTRTLVGNYALKQVGVSIRLLDNPGRIQATGWNVGIRAASGAYVLRIDAVHCRLQSTDYVRRCLDQLLELQQSDAGVAAVGGRRLSVNRADNAWSDAIVTAQSCRFGVGNATYRMDGAAGFKDTLGVPLYDRRALLQVGLFDESLGRSEDNDLHARLRWQGFKLYFTPEVVALYHPRTTLSGLASQMFHNGWWISATIMHKCSFPFGFRHLIPFGFYLTLAILLVLSVSGLPFALVLLSTLLGVYLLGSLVAALEASMSLQVWRVAFVFWMMHACYAAGTTAGFFARKSGRAEIGVITSPGANIGS
jgi:glycosyltransferase involved in cell wall biosynthesis